MALPVVEKYKNRQQKEGNLVWWTTNVNHNGDGPHEEYVYFECQLRNVRYSSETTTYCDISLNDGTQTDRCRVQINHSNQNNWSQITTNKQIVATASTQDFWTAAPVEGKAQAEVEDDLQDCQLVEAENKNVFLKAGGTN